MVTAKTHRSPGSPATKRIPETNSPTKFLDCSCIGAPGNLVTAMATERYGKQYRAEHEYAGETEDLQHHASQERTGHPGRGRRGRIEAHCGGDGAAGELACGDIPEQATAHRHVRRPEHPADHGCDRNVRKRQRAGVRRDQHRDRDGERHRERPEEEPLAIDPIRNDADEWAAQCEGQHPQHGDRRDEQRRFGDLERIDPEDENLHPPKNAGQTAEQPDDQKSRRAEQGTAGAHQLCRNRATAGINGWAPAHPPGNGPAIGLAGLPLPIAVCKGEFFARSMPAIVSRVVRTPLSVDVDQEESRSIRPSPGDP